MSYLTLHAPGLVPGVRRVATVVAYQASKESLHIRRISLRFFEVKTARCAADIHQPAPFGAGVGLEPTSSLLVHREGLEPSRLTAAAFEAAVATDYTICACRPTLTPDGIEPRNVRLRQLAICLCVSQRTRTSTTPALDRLALPLA